MAAKESATQRESFGCVGERGEGEPSKVEARKEKYVPAKTQKATAVSPGSAPLLVSVLAVPPV